MARKKSSVIGVEDDPKVDQNIAALEHALETTSRSFSTSLTNQFCPHCSSVFTNLTIRVYLPSAIVKTIV